MELDELKSEWNSLPAPADATATPALNAEPSWQRRYRQPLRRILMGEWAGALVCLMGIVYIIANLDQWVSLYGKILAVVTCFVLAGMAFIGIFSTRFWLQEPDYAETYARSVEIFAEQKMRFARWQQFNVLASHFLLVLLMLLMMFRVTGKPVLEQPVFWTIAFSVGYLFLFFYARWVMHYYRRQIREAALLLQEMAPE